MEVASGVHHFATGPFNWYLIEEANRLTLVDAGFPGHYGTLVNGLRAIGKELKDIEAVILTHAHADHIGFAERVRRQTKAPVFIHTADLERSKRRLQLPWVGLLSHAWRPYMAAVLATATIKGVFTGQPVTQAQPIQDGDRLDVPGQPITLHVPGHTPGEVAFYLPERRVLISGDALVTRDLYRGTIGAPMLPNEGLNFDSVAAARNLDRLRELGTLIMLPGHGPAWNGSMAEAVAGVRQR